MSLKFWDKADTAGKRAKIILSLLGILFVVVEGCYLMYKERLDYMEMKQDVCALQEALAQDSVRLYTLHIELGNLRDSLKAHEQEKATQDAKSQDTYAVGYRYDKVQKKRYYRDWSGTFYELYPDPDWSTMTEKFYYYVNPKTGFRKYPFTD